MRDFGSPTCPAGQQSVINRKILWVFGQESSFYATTSVRSVACAGCVAGYYGPDCSGVCNCGPNGSCNDDIDGDGTCSCDEGWGGTLCNDCAPGHFGLDCTPCACGEGASCSDGLFGSGECGCDDPSLNWNGVACVGECAPGFAGAEAGVRISTNALQRPSCSRCVRTRILVHLGPA